MTNPFKPHASNLFADRESIDAVMIYVSNVINSMEPGQDRIAATTAIMILVNTAAKVWPEADAPVAEAAPASELSLVRADLDARLVALADRVAVLEVTPVTPEALAQGIEAWADDNIDSHIENWADTYLGDRIDTWTTDNLDIEDDVQEEVRKVLRDVTISLDL